MRLTFTHARAAIAALALAVLAPHALAQSSFQQLSIDLFNATSTAQITCPERFQNAPQPLACGRTPIQFSAFETFLDLEMAGTLEQTTTWQYDEENTFYLADFDGPDGSQYRVLYGETPPGQPSRIFLTEVTPPATPQAQQADPAPSQPADVNGASYNWHANADANLPTDVRAWLDEMAATLDLHEANCPIELMAQDALLACYDIPPGDTLPERWRRAQPTPLLPTVSWDRNRDWTRASTFLTIHDTSAYITAYKDNFLTPQFQGKSILRF